MATQGTVKWFNNSKGYGFICPNNSEQDIFVHFSSIEMEGYKCLRAGQQVDFEVHDGPKGLHAINIKPSMEDEGGIVLPEQTSTREYVKEQELELEEA